MKKSIVLLLSLIFSTFVFSQESLKSDINIYKDITQAYENQYYPGVIEKVSQLQKEYPDSVFIQPALVYRGSALVNLKCYDDAIETLSQAIAHMHTGQKGFTQCHYLLGQAYFNLKNYEKASDCFFIATKLADLDKDNFHYNYSIFYFAESYYNMDRFEDIYPVYEYVIEHGKNYSKEDYDVAVQKLMICYNKSSLYKKTTDLYNSFDLDFFKGDIKSIIQLYAANAFENQKQYKDAYNIYCDVIKHGNENHAIVALKNAYNLSESKKIDVNPGAVFAQSTATFAKDPELVNEFWVRLGIDEYNKGHFNKAQEYFSKSEKDMPLVAIYNAKIILDTDDSVEGGKKAEEILLGIKNLHSEKNKDIKNLSDTYFSLLLQCAVQQENWDSVPSLFRSIKNPDSKAIYINSAYYYKKGEYGKVSPAAGDLYGSALCYLGKYNEACDIFGDLDKKGALSKNHLIEYGKALYMSERYEEAFNVVLRSNDIHKNYIAGLCKVNIGDFEKAKQFFITYIKEFSGKSDFNNLALYYKGYSEYAMEEYKNSYATFVRFASVADNDLIAYTHKAHYYAAISSLQLKDYTNGAVQAKNVIKTASTEDEKIRAVVFAAEILTDAGKYDQAIELLLPYAEGTKSQFTVEAIFKIAKIYEKQGLAEMADKMYTTVYTNYSGTEFAEEAMYRAAEVYYFQEDYSTAYSKFNDYIYKYVSGKLLDGALYFAGDCAMKVGEISKSIMINKNLVAKFPESVYAYGAYKNLLECYYEKGDYSSALDIAKLLVSNYEEQAAGDKIGTKLLELEKIVKGTDRRIVEKMSQFESAGGAKTKKGREIGSEIVKLYGENSYTQKYGYDLALELLQYHQDGDKPIFSAENAEFVGDYLIASGENKKAADYYLMAAKYYRNAGNSMKAAAVLYSATDAFASGGFKGDALETANLLKELYPETKYAERVDRIVR